MTTDRHFHETDQEELFELVKKNHKMLKAMNRRERTRSFFSWLKWLLILTFFVFGYLQLKPVFDTMMGVYEKLGEQSESLSGLTDRVGNFNLDSLKGIFETEETQ